MISDYKILSNSSLSNLQLEVNAAIKLGWQPLGGLSTTTARVVNYKEPAEGGMYCIMYSQALGKH